jgi:alpha-L-arabinofuranosidase
MFPEVLDAYTRAPTFGTAGADGVEVSVPRGDAVVTIDREGGDLAAALSNLHPDDALECQVWVPGRRMLGAGRLSTLTGASPRSFNDVSHPDDVTTSTAELPVHGDTCRLVLGPHSVNILRLQTEVS